MEVLECIAAENDKEGLTKLPSNYPDLCRYRDNRGIYLFLGNWVFRARICERDALVS